MAKREPPPTETIERIRDQLARLREASEITLRGYQVTSHAPVVGPLIARVRRMVTAHLREPYIDPILERQEAFNREMVRAVEEIAARLVAEPEANSAALDMQQLKQARRTLDECAQQLDDWLDAISRQRAALPTPAPDTIPSAQELAALRARLDDVRATLARLVNSGDRPSTKP